MKRFLPAMFVLGLLLLAGCGEEQNPVYNEPPNAAVTQSPVELTPVSFQDLLDKRVAGHKGKIVVIDVWASFCPPCKAEFHNLVRMHHTYGDKGLVCMSLSVDKRDAKPAALAFLKRQNASFANFWLENPRAAANKWDFQSIPTVVVYGRDGQLARVFTEDFTYDDVETYVKKLLI